MEKSEKIRGQRHGGYGGFLIDKSKWNYAKILPIKINREQIRQIKQKTRTI